MTTHPLEEYFRCPKQLAVLATAEPLPHEEGYFSFGAITCFGRQSVGTPAATPDASLSDIARGISSANGQVLLPFELAEVLANMRFELYPEARRAREDLSRSSFSRSVYYRFRPFLTVGLRRHLQRLSLSGWRQIPFPRWPVDVSVETLMKQAAGLVIERGGVSELPFVWFWPDGAPACVMMTHDVEGAIGTAFCDQLMDLDESFGIKSSFQIIPEVRGTLSAQVVARFRNRGFEVEIHDLNHDGFLFRNRELFLERVARINQYARDYGCSGFRSGALYRRQDWYADLDVAFDMSVPSVAHLEPQRGGCCTVMPYFVGNVLELPLTTMQDYSLFHVVGDYSISRWKEQVSLILANNGLASFNTHPDYLIPRRAGQTYSTLLGYLEQLREERGVWIALPAEVNQWWRNRQEMRVVPQGGSWRVEGQGSSRARLAFARLRSGSVVYEVGTSP